MSLEDINALEEEDKNSGKAPRAQYVLAEEVTGMVHGAEGLAAAKRITQSLFSGALHDMTEADFAQLAQDGMPTIKLERDADLQQALVNAELVPSRGQARTMIGSNAVTINGEKRRQLMRPIHHHAGSVARLMAPSSVENRWPICAGPSCHCAASWAATAGAVIRMPGAMAAKTIMAVSSRGGQGSAAEAAGAETESLDINLIPQALSDDEISRPARLRAGGGRAINGEYVLALFSGRRQRRPLSGVNRGRESRRRPVRCGSPRRFWRKYCAYGFSPWTAKYPASGRCAYCWRLRAPG